MTLFLFSVLIVATGWLSIITYKQRRELRHLQEFISESDTVTRKLYTKISNLRIRVEQLEYDNRERDETLISLTTGKEPTKEK